MGNMGSSSVEQQRAPGPITRSRCSTESVTATHNFEVTSFTLLEGMGAGKSVSSSTFSVGGYDWKIVLYPDGRWKEDEAAYVLLRLCKVATGVKVMFTLSLLEKDGTASKHCNLPSAVNTTFATVGHARGFTIEKSKLQQLLSLNDNCFTIRCVLTVVKEHRIEDVIIPVPPLSQSNLREHFANMLKDGEGVDVTFSVGGQLFRAHRCVLAARSLVFKAELFGQMKETTTQCIKIDDMEPFVFEALLHFIYTDSLPNNPYINKNATMQHLLVAADRYGLERLRVMCERKLCRSIDVPTVATTLALAEQHRCVHLKNACLRLLSPLDVRRAVKETDGFKHLVTSCPSIFMDIFYNITPPS